MGGDKQTIKGDENLTFSDWITFLSSEKNLNMGLIVSMSAFVVAVIALVVAAVAATPNPSWVDYFIGPVVVLVIGLCLLWTYGNQLRRRSERAGELLDKIMLEKLKDVSAIKLDDIYKQYETRYNQSQDRKTKKRRKTREGLPRVERNVDQ